MLSPTWEYCLRLPSLHLPDDTTHAYHVFYADLMVSFWNECTDGRAHVIVRPELLNVSSILTEWLKVSHPDAIVIQAVLSHAEWSQYVGSPTNTLLEHIVEHPIDDKVLLAECYQCLEHVLFYHGGLPEAERYFNMALQAHISAGNLFEAANNRQYLGQLYLRTH